MRNQGLKDEAKEMEEKIKNNSDPSANRETKSLLQRMRIFINKAKQAEGVTEEALALLSRITSKVTKASDILSSYF